jgi:hypothetical protein
MCHKSSVQSAAGISVRVDALIPFPAVTVPCPPTFLFGKVRAVTLLKTLPTTALFGSLGGRVSWRTAARYNLWFGEALECLKLLRFSSAVKRRYCLLTAVLVLAGLISHAQATVLYSGSFSGTWNNPVLTGIIFDGKIGAPSRLPRLSFDLRCCCPEPRCAGSGGVRRGDSTILDAITETFRDAFDDPTFTPTLNLSRQDDPVGTP